MAGDEAPAVVDPADVQITVTEVGVSFGDHGQDVVRPLRAVPGETVEDLIRRAGFYGRQKWRAPIPAGSYLIIRVVDEGDRPKAVDPVDVDPF